MANSMIRATMALLATFVLVGCGSTPWQSQSTNNPVAQPTQAPAVVMTQAAPAASQPLVARPKKEHQVVVGQFPTSSKPAQGKPWTTMHAQGFTGNYSEASKLLGLNTAQAKKYEEMHSAGACQVMDVPNGVVLDRLTFTRDGKHHIDYGAKVALENPSSRKTEVCDLGGGVVAMRFHGCNNHAVVVGWNAKATVIPTPAPAPAYMCAKKIGEVSVWATDVVAKVPGLADAIAKVRAGKSGYYDPAEVSRGFGARIRAVGTPITSADVVTVKFHRASGGVTELFKGSVVGKQRFELPADAVDADVVQIVFGGLDKYVYPPQDLRGKVSEYKGGCVINASHAILR